MNPKLAKILKVLAPILIQKWRARQAAKRRPR
jgi:hypothetical protein